jgi:hypothetical protein
VGVVVQRPHHTFEWRDRALERVAIQGLLVVEVDVR